MRLAEAKAIAERLVEELAPACERIEIAGGIRRGKAEPHDIEIVAMPILKPPRAEFGQKVIHKTALDAVLYGLVQAGRLREVKGREKYKQFVVRGGEVNEAMLDLFLVTPPAQWGVIYTIRTGPGGMNNNFSQWIVTTRSRGGALPDGYRVKDGAVWLMDEWRMLDMGGSVAQSVRPLAMPEEQDFLDFLGLGWIEPRERMARWERHEFSHQ